MSDLQEQLARRLHAIFHHGAPAWEDCEPHAANRWRDLAAECIRQMEWARRERHIPLHEYPDPASKIIGWAPLTLAPDDWQP